MARVLLNRLQQVTDGVLPESQCGFRANRSTTDMIFTLRQLQEKAAEQNQPLYMVFIDFTKAFDTVNRDCLWKILQTYGCPPKLISMIKQLHNGMQAQVNLNGSISTAFPVAQGVKQGCVLAPTLFALYLTAVLELCPAANDEGIHMKTRSDGGLFNVSRLRASTKVRKICAAELLYADDSALVAHSPEVLQRMLNKFASAASDLGLTINVKKTEVMYQPTPFTPYNPPNIVLNGNRISDVPHFTYLGSTVSNTNSTDKEVEKRISSAAAAFGRLQSKVWKRPGIQTKTKCKVYRAVVQSCLLYGTEACTLYRRHVKKLNSVQQRHLRQIMHIKWQDKVPNVEILRKADIPSVEASITKAQLRWAGHVRRMDDSRLPKAVCYGELCKGKRRIGRPRLRYKDCLKRNLAASGISTKDWETKAAQRPLWRSTIAKAAAKIDADNYAAYHNKKKK